MHTTRRSKPPLSALPLLILFSVLALGHSGPIHPQAQDFEADASPFLLQSTQAEVTISGPIAHVVVTQAWNNPNPFPVDGVYIFPLPEDAAVTDMSLRIGDRWIRGDMRRRQEARAIYEQARSQGKIAGLLEQERPNIFAQHVANIMPGKQIDVVIAFDQPVECEDGSCEYVFPTVVGPRFIPASQPDPGKIDPLVVGKNLSTGQTFDLELELDAGVNVTHLESPSHRIHVSRHNDSQAHVALASGDDRRLDRDFRLRWRVGSEAPEVGLLSWRDPRQEDEPGVFSLILQPPQAPGAEEISPRELVFVLDCSGSMSGVPLATAKNVVRQALGAVRSGDTFQIIRFSEVASGLGSTPLQPTPYNIQRAVRYLDSLRGQGGTHMLSGIQAALDYPADPERLRIVVFLTDGFIGNERQILAEVQKKLGRTRIFSFGIGSSVNRYLLESLAEEGRGEAAFLGPRESADDMVERFVKRISAPVLTDVRITWEDLEVRDLEPARIPDLFAGQPILLHGRYSRPGTGVVHVEGRVSGRTETFSRIVSFPEEASDHEALGRLWARARIHRIEREQHQGLRSDAVEAITQLGLRHRLMTAYTSLVAVDSEVSNTTGNSTRMEVPVEMPQDVSYEGIFGAPANSAAMLRLSAGAPPSSGHSGVSGLPFMMLSARRPPQALEKGKRYDLLSAYAADDERIIAKQLNRKAHAMFDRILLVRPDGTHVTIEPDGEVWHIDARKRTLMRTLTVSEIATLRQALAGISTQSWSGGGSGPRLVIETGGTSRTLALPAHDPGVDVVVRLIERWAS
ncbi:MAG: VIT and VWA domain-containing protein [Acidobacteriota bacterium]